MALPGTSVPNISAPSSSDTLIQGALKVLQTPDSYKKAKFTHQLVKLWNEGQITSVGSAPIDIPDKPQRDDRVNIAHASRMPNRGKGRSLQQRQSMLHSIVHIESWAVDLSWDIIVRFGGSELYSLPKEFFDDYVKVASDEARHFELLEERLRGIGANYGDFIAHDGLWQSAMKTSGSLPARLAVEHCVHEARGLDIMPQTVRRFRDNGDEDTATLLEDVIYKEEITHCAAGCRWIKYLYKTASELNDEGAPDWVINARAYDSVDKWFVSIVLENFGQRLKPPFNHEARAQAGFHTSWYMPLQCDRTIVKPKDESSPVKVTVQKDKVEDSNGSETPA